MTKAKAIVGSYVGVLVLAAPIFLGAWKLAYRQGLLYVGVALVGTTLNHLLVRAGSDITEDRAARAHAGQGWDKRILGAYFLVSVVTFAVAGLDSGRFGWSGRVPAGVAIAGVVSMLVGQLAFAFAKRENAFFSSTVRIQDERGHQVCDTGLYRFVRHPGYLGMLLSLLAFPLLMESFWAFIPASVGALLLIARTRLEDRFLMNRLPGYADYAARTRWRLIPGVF
ncbi:MAG: isoprenylcysteine carboxylmethyltransferase family protein [Minicystis sp.]